MCDLTFIWDGTSLRDMNNLKDYMTDPNAATMYPAPTSIPSIVLTLSLTNLIEERRYFLWKPVRFLSRRFLTIGVWVVEVTFRNQVAFLVVEMNRAPEWCDSKVWLEEFLLCFVKKATKILREFGGQALAARLCHFNSYVPIVIIAFGCVWPPIVNVIDESALEIVVGDTEKHQ